MKTENQNKGSMVALPMTDLAKHIKDSEIFLGASQNINAQLASSAFSTYFTFRGNNEWKLTCRHPNINATSRVFISISEYDTDPQINRFVGLAKLQVFNVSPFNGGVVVWINIGWGSTINIRLDVLVEP